jgi:long-chain fatty acid transport protein
MNMKQLPRKTLLALVLAGSFTAAHATNGYFAHGYGIKAKGMGGASVAMTHDAFAGANNPAAAAFAGNRWDLGAEIFSPRRSMSRDEAVRVTQPAFLLDDDLLWSDGVSKSGKNVFLVPEFGYNVQHSDKIGLNLTVYGNGGMNTAYPAGGFDSDLFGAGGANALGSPGKLGVDLMQLIVAPTLAYKFSEKSAVGISPLLVYQRFKAYGLGLFQGFSESGDSVTDNGYSSSTGIGVRLGYMAKLNDQVTFGASYAPKINMGKFDKYKGLFAEGGDFDIPENYTIGLAIQATPTVQVAMDYQRINYSDVASINNPGSNIYPFFAAPGPSTLDSRLGASAGPGFGWQDINVIKLGVQWQVSPSWTLRAGYNRGDNPIKSSDVTFNILAPGVVKDHFTLGGTMAIDKQSELSFFFMHARKNSISGPNLFDMTEESQETISMYQNSIGVQYSKKF